LTRIFLLVKETKYYSSKQEKTLLVKETKHYNPKQEKTLLVKKIKHYNPKQDLSRSQNLVNIIPDNSLIKRQHTINQTQLPSKIKKVYSGLSTLR
jgi:hypothetical protein